LHAYDQIILIVILKGGFGTNTTAFGVTATNTGIFGKPTGFGTATPASTATTGFSFANNNNNNSNIFGGTAAQKPFGGIQVCKIRNILCYYLFFN